MKTIQLTQGKTAIVDDGSYKELSKFKWCYSKGYAIRGIRSRKEGWQKQIHMHRVVNNTPSGMFTDHINRNTLDNRKENLRTVDRRNNALNNGKKIRGVYKIKNRNGWMAQLKVNGKTKYIGYYPNQAKALMAVKKYENDNRISKTTKIKSQKQSRGLE